jgi:hypothetical protein
LRALAILLLCCTLAAGCRVASFGPRVSTFEPAHSPRGVAARVEAGGERLDGELLLVGPEDIHVLADDEIVRIAYAAITRATFHQVPDAGFGGRRTPPDDTLRQLRLVSRFPFGLADDVLARLLEFHGQDEPRAVVP